LDSEHTQVEYADGSVLTFRFDSLGTLTWIDFTSDGQAHSTNVNHGGGNYRPITQQDALGNITYLDWDQSGQTLRRLSNVVNGTVHSTTFNYGPHNNLTEVRGPTGSI